MANESDELAPGGLFYGSQCRRIVGASSCRSLLPPCFTDRPRISPSMGGRLHSAVVKTLVAVDWVMSFDYPWVSTMLPAIYMIECLYAGLALAGILCFFASGDYPIEPATGPSTIQPRMLFGFALFWSGLTFAQYLTIWYGNIPEEVVFFTRRFSLLGGTGLFAASISLLFVIPFTVFLDSSGPKKCANSGHSGTSNSGWLVNRTPLSHSALRTVQCRLVCDSALRHARSYYCNGLSIEPAGCAIISAAGCPPRTNLAIVRICGSM